MAGPIPKSYGGDPLAFLATLPTTGHKRTRLSQVMRPSTGKTGLYDLVDLYDDGSQEAAQVPASEAFERQSKGARISADEFAAASRPEQNVTVMDKDGSPRSMSYLEAARQGLRPVSDDVARARVARFESASAARPDPAEMYGPELRLEGLKPTLGPLAEPVPQPKAIPEEPGYHAPLHTGWADKSGMPRPFESVRSPRSLDAALETVGVGTTDTGSPRVAGDFFGPALKAPQNDFERAQEEGKLLDMLTRQGAGFDASARAIAGLPGGATPNAALRNAPKQELLEREAYADQHEGKDSNSAASAHARALLKSVAPGTFTDEQLAGITADEFAKAIDVAKIREGFEARKEAGASEERRHKETLKAQDMAREESRTQRQFEAGQRSADRALAREDRLDRDAQAERDRLGKEQDAAIHGLGEAYDKSGVQGFQSVAKEVEPILSRDEPLPGVGPVRSRAPDSWTSQDGLTLRRGLGQALAQYAKGLSGTGMSEAERENYKRISGLAETGSDQSIRDGWKLMKSAMTDRARAIAGAFKPEAVKTYGQRVPDFAAAVGGGAAPGPSASPAEGSEHVGSDGKRYRLQGGKYYLVGG